MPFPFSANSSVRSEVHDHHGQYLCKQEQCNSTAPMLHVACCPWFQHIVLSANSALRRNIGDLNLIFAGGTMRGKTTERNTHQQIQWAGTGNGQPGSHQRFNLLNKRVCSKAMCVLVGFSPQTWTRTVRQCREEIHHERQHGNTVISFKISIGLINIKTNT